LLTSRWRIQLGLLGLGAVVYSLVAAGRLDQQSSDPHFVYQADAWLDGRLTTEPMPRGADDPARVETVELKNGERVRGRRLMTRRLFRTTGGREIPVAEIARSIGKSEYVSFPPFPAALMLPQVLVVGKRANDVVFTVAIAAVCLPLLFGLLCRLSRRGESDRTIADNLWLTLLFGFGTVFFFSAVQGRVWFTAHVVGAAIALLYFHFSLGARYPILAGLALGCATLTRMPMAFMFPLFVYEAWRACGGRAELRAVVRKLALFAAPVLAIAAIAVAYNMARFDVATEFGHSYLAVRQQAQIETQGFFDLAYLGRNLTVAFTLLPDIGGDKSWVQISGHGMAIWVTTPALLLLLWPRRKSGLGRALWITVACVALPTLLYQNSGWVQFGYRFALDYMVFLIALLAIGGRPFTRWVHALVIASIVINLFGAITFNRYHQVYKTDARTYASVVAN
jgi:hypothetical protein